MTLIVSVLLYFFGLDAASGTLDYKCKDKTGITTTKTISTNKYPQGVKRDLYGNIIIYDPEYNPSLHPVYYQSPNIIVPNPHLNDHTNNNLLKTDVTHYPLVPSWSSSPEYQS